MDQQSCCSPVLKGAKKWVAIIKKNLPLVRGHESILNLSPQQCIDILAKLNCLNFSRVHQRIQMSSDTWKANFLKLRGLGILLSALETLGSGKIKSILDTHASMECVSSIMSLVNSHVGLDYVLASHDFLNSLIEG